MCIDVILGHFPHLANVKRLMYYLPCENKLSDYMKIMSALTQSHRAIQKIFFTIINSFNFLVVPSILYHICLNKHASINHKIESLLFEYTVLSIHNLT